MVASLSSLLLSVTLTHYMSQHLPEGESPPGHPTEGYTPSPPGTWRDSLDSSRDLSGDHTEECQPDTAGILAGQEARPE